MRNLTHFTPYEQYAQILRDTTLYDCVDTCEDKKTDVRSHKSELFHMFNYHLTSRSQSPA